MRYIRTLAIAAAAFLALAAHAQSVLWYAATAPQPLVDDTAAHRYETTPSYAVSITGSRAGVHVVGGPLTIDIRPPSNGTLNVGDYENAYLAPGNGQVPGLSVTTSSASCTSASGRFWVQEFDVDSGGNLLHVAIDFEYHCDGTAPAIYGEVRYNSTRLLTVDKPANSTTPDTLMFPWRSAMPQSTLVTSDTLRVYGINAAAAISITGGEYSVNGGPWTTAAGTVQNLDLVTMRTTTPAASNSTNTVILSVDTAMVLFNAQTYDPNQLLDGFVLSSGGNVIASAAFQSANSQRWTLTPLLGPVGPRPDSVSVVATGAPDERFVMSFSAFPGSLPAVGAYENAGLYSLDGVHYDLPGGPALQVYSGQYDLCLAERGRFVILELSLAPDGTIVRFAADFEEQCGNNAPVFGEVRYHSTIPLTSLKPASNATDAYFLTGPFPVRAGSTVVSNTISVLGSTGAVPVAISGGEYSINGGAFTSANGTANPQDHIVVRTTAFRRAGLTRRATLVVGNQLGYFDVTSYATNDALSGLAFRSMPGDPVGQGQSRTEPIGPFGPGFLSFTTSPYLSFTSLTQDGDKWTISLGPFGGAPLALGSYENAMSKFYAPSISFDLARNNGAQCDVDSTARFTVLDASYNNGALESLAVDFEYHCNGPATPPLYGELRYHTTVPFSSMLPRLAKIDFDNDGLADTLFTTADGAVRVVTATVDQVIIGAGTGKTVVATGDFDGDGRTDLLVLNAADGSTEMWLSTFSAGVSTWNTSVVMQPGTSWRATQVGDFNGDGKSDIVWTNAGDGSVALWLMNGMTIVQRGLIMNPLTGWSVTAAADFNGDGNTDLLWRHTDGTSSVWLMRGLTVLDRGPIMAAGTPWQLARVGDFNGDGRADILWNNPSDNMTSAWMMAGRTVVERGVLMPAGTGWSAQVVGDLDGDGRDDIVWANADGRVGLWLMNGRFNVARAPATAVGTGWIPARADDLDGDGRADLFWVTPDNSGTPVWLMNGLTTASTRTVGGAGWRVWAP